MYAIIKKSKSYKDIVIICLYTDRDVFRRDLKDFQQDLDSNEFELEVHEKASVAINTFHDGAVLS
jgi:hypothetical protein